jgi:hypothetical protein
MQMQTERIFFSLLDKAVWSQEDGKEVIKNWLSIYKKDVKDFKTSADEGYNKVTDPLSKTA